MDFPPGYVLPKGPGGTIADVDLYAMQPDGSGVRQLTSGAEGADRDPAWSSDGSMLAFVRFDRRSFTANIFAGRADGTGLHQITFCRFANCVRSPSWSPRGDQLVYSRGTDLYLIRPDGRNNHLIVRCRCTFIDAAWSPDGRSIAFTGEDAIREYPGLLFAVRPDGSDLRMLDECDSSQCTSGLQDASPAWSPDGAWIAFFRDGGIWLIRPDGSKLHRLVSNASRPAWSPDGAEIAFVRRQRIYVMSSAGTDVRQIRRSGWLGSWQPLPLSP
jgi:Tol biopolymer transport system component